MKNIILTTILLFSFVWSYGQQEQQYTQFMYNKLGYNPGYAGSHSTACITGLYRNQWIGIEGAPQTQALSANIPLMNQRVGVGINLNHHTIGITERWTLDGAYSYRIPMGRGYLGLGLQGSVRYLGNDYDDPRLESNVAISLDGAVPVGLQNKYVPNFGVGAYYNTERFYIGISVPRLLLNNVDFNDIVGEIGKEVHHGYFMAGLRMRMTDKVDFQPQILLKYANNAPFDADVNASLIFNDRFTAGLSYRVGGSTNRAGDSVDLLIGAQLNNQILLGLSYDLTMSELRDNTSGSIELLVRYCLGSSGNSEEDFVNPRFF